MANKKVKFELTAVDKTKAAFDKATKGLKSVGGVAKTASKAVAGVGLAAVGAGAALTVFINKSFQYIDTLDKTSKRTGISTDTLQAFQLAAIESGSSIEQTQKGLEKFARSIGDASRGLKTQADIFKDLDVELKNADGSMKSFDEILISTAEGVKNLGSESEKATALANLFGRSGLTFSEVFRNGAEGLRDFNKRAEDLGIILDKDMIQNVAKFNDTVSVIKLQIGAFANNITGALVPAFQMLAERLGTTITDSKNTAEGFDALGKSIAVSILTGLHKAIIAVQDFFTQVQIGFAKTKISLGLEANISQQALQTIDLIKEFEDSLKFLESGNANFTGKNLEEAILRTKNKIALLNQELLLEFNPSRVPLTFLEDMIKAVEEGGATWEQFFPKVEGGLTNLLSPMEVFQDQLNQVDKTVQTLAVSSMKKFEDSIIDSLKSGKLEFKNFADYVVEQLLRIAIQQTVIEPLTGRFESFFKSFGSIFGKKALGGSVNAGKPYMVGESGRELFVPNQSGQIVSNQDLKQMSGGQSAPTVNFNISTVDAAGFDELLASRKGLITSIINNAMNNRGRMGVT